MLGRLGVLSRQHVTHKSETPFESSSECPWDISSRIHWTSDSYIGNTTEKWPFVIKYHWKSTTSFWAPLFMKLVLVMGLGGLTLIFCCAIFCYVPQPAFQHCRQTPGIVWRSESLLHELGDDNHTNGEYSTGVCEQIIVWRRTPFGRWAFRASMAWFMAAYIFFEASFASVASIVCYVAVYGFRDLARFSMTPFTTGLWKKHSFVEEDPWEDGLSEDQSRGCGAISAAELRGNGSPIRNMFFTDTGMFEAATEGLNKSNLA